MPSLPLGPAAPSPFRPRNPYLRNRRPSALSPTTTTTPPTPSSPIAPDLPLDATDTTCPDDDTPPPSPASPLPIIQPPPHPLPPTILPNTHADHPDYIVTEADDLLHIVYGDNIHKNAGTHLSGAIPDDYIWQNHWLRIVQITSIRYQVPTGKIGRRFLTIFTSELRGVRIRHWNSERPLVFVATVLQATPGVRRSKDIRQRLNQRMDLWEQGHHKALVDDTECEALSRQPSSRPPTEDSIARAFNARVLSGRLRSAVRTLTDCSGGGVRQPGDLCSKTGRPVWQVLQEKHPALRNPELLNDPHGAFEPYPTVPTAITICVTPEDVELICSRLSGAAGPSGTDAVELANWLLRFGSESDALRSEMAEWTN